MTAVGVACAALVACAVMLFALRRAHVKADRRLEAIVHHIDRSLDAMSADIAAAVATAVDVDAGRRATALTLDFDALVESIVSEAAARTAADAAAFWVEGPGKRPIVASFGPAAAFEFLERSYGPPSGRAFRAATVGWTYGDTNDHEKLALHSALVTPLPDEARMPGTLAVYSRSPDAFRPEHASALQDLLADVRDALLNARRFAEIEARINIDPVTGVPNRRAYEVELGREIERAHRAGLPLSLVLVGLDGADDESGDERDEMGALARLVTRATRNGDIACRRGERELAVLLPKTEEAGASVLKERLTAEVRQLVAQDTSSVAIGVVEWEPSESAEALDARVEHTLSRPKPAGVPALEDVRNASTVHSTIASGGDLHRAEASDRHRRDTVAALARELNDQRRSGRSIALVILEVHGLDDEMPRSEPAAPEILFRVLDGGLRRHTDGGSVHRLAPNEFALVLPGSSVVDAEALVDSLQASLDAREETDTSVLSAGITELADTDDAPAGIGRAEHALWQARQAGYGTVVVALPSRRTRPHH